MLSKLLIAASAVSLLASPVLARGHDRGRDYGYDHRYYSDRGYYGGRGAGRDRGYYRDDRDGRGCRKDSNTGGTVLGAIGGGLIGNAAGERGDRGRSTILGAGLGALLGNRIDAGEYRCR